RRRPRPRPPAGRPPSTSARPTRARGTAVRVRKASASALSSLPAQPAAVHDEDMAVDVIACRGGEEDGRTRQIFRLAPAAGGDAFEYLPVARLVLLQGRRVVGAHVAGRDGVDVDAFRRP